MHGVTSLHAFGSILREDFTSDSDIDLLIDFDQQASENLFRRYFDFKEAIEKLLERPVDLITSESITNPFFRQEVEATKTALYAA
jgi:hypothetical protein